MLIESQQIAQNSAPASDLCAYDIATSRLAQLKIQPISRCFSSTEQSQIRRAELNRALDTYRIRLGKIIQGPQSAQGDPTAHAGH